MYYVDHIQSISHPDQIYVGYTNNLNARLQTHNAGESVYTAFHRPWKLILCHAFDDELKARRFEQYLKAPSGRAFSKNDFNNSLFVDLSRHSHAEAVSVVG